MGLKIFANHLRKTHIYKQQVKHYLLLASPAHMLAVPEIEIPVTIEPGDY